jgi:hypothetical protein
LPSSLLQQQTLTMKAPALTQQVRLALALGRMVTGSLSVIASSVLIYKIFSRYRVQRHSSSAIANTNVTTYHRIVLGMSIVDVLFSMGSAAGPLAVPASAGDDMVFGIHGTTATCTAQGAASQLLGAVVLYTAALNTFFMLKICYNVSDAVMSRRYEPWLHAIPLVYSIATTSTGIAMQIFNPMIPYSDLGCWIAAYPKGCFLRPETCTRGKRLFASPSASSWYAWSFIYAWVFLAFAIVLVNLLLIYTAIRRQERRNERYGQVVATTPKKPASSQPTESPHAVATLIPQGDETESNSYSSQDRHSSKEETVSQNKESDSAHSHDGKGEPMDNGNKKETICGTSSSALDAESTMPKNIGIMRKSSKVARKSKTSRLAAVQSTLFCSATFVPAFVLCVPWLGFKIGDPSARANLVFAFLLQYLLATQGIFNLLIYIRPSYNRLRKNTSEWSRSKCLWACLFSSDPKYW